MARRLGRRKQPSREKHMMDEQTKVDSGIFDEKTMVFLGKFFNKGIISKLSFITARGKEADVYLAEAGASDTVKGEQYVVMKFFRIETSSFFNMEDYMIGDPRFKKIGSSKYAIVREWCKKEFGNLQIAQRAQVRAPRPFMFNGSIIAMSFIGDNSVPAPQLKNATLENPEKALDIILGDIGKLYSHGLVHADVSEYNILIKEQKPYMIDFGQAVVTKHPKAEEFLERDVKNILYYFRKTYGVKRELSEMLAAIKTRP